MGVVNRPETELSGWTLRTGEASLQLILSQAEIGAGEIPAGDVAGFGITVNALSAHAPVTEELLNPARAIVIEVVPSSSESLSRLVSLRAAHPHLPMVAAVREPSVQVVRALLKAGVNDVVSLPLKIDELRTVLDQLRADMQRTGRVDGKIGKIVSVVRSVGGVGATTLATQAASIHAHMDAGAGRTTCLFDLDLQFGNAGTYLGVRPKLTLQDLLEAGSRVDGALLKSACAQTATGLNVIAAPVDIVPLESVSADQILNIVELAANEFDTVYLDLPGNWTNWSLSLVARSDAVLLVVETTIASLRQAKRQLALMRSQGLSDAPIQIVVNRVEKKLFRPISLTDVERALGNDVSYSIANDFNLVSTALDQGVLVSDLKAGSKVAKDIGAIVEGCEMLFERSDA
ncbi:MAG: CpaE family protein [Sphingomonadaceae bacterium]